MSLRPGWSINQDPGEAENKEKLILENSKPKPSKQQQQTVFFMSQVLHGHFYSWRLSQGIELELLWLCLDITIKPAEKLYSNNIHLREKARKSFIVHMGNNMVLGEQIPFRFA